MSETTFNNLGLSPTILGIVEKLNFVVPTPIQVQSIPVALTGADLIGIAQTGTGKTLAFGLPILQRLFKEQTNVSLVILPTRELALQVDEFFKKLGASSQLKTTVLIGGANMSRQIQQLKRRPHVIISTPGRLIDHLHRKTINLSSVGTLVLDEADRMLDMGFAPQIKEILHSVPTKRQTMLFSATMPDGIVKIANDYMKMPVRVEVAPAGSATANVTHEIFFVHKPNKIELLEDILKKYQGTVLVFSRTKFGAKKIAAAVRNMHHTATEIHSDRSLSQRITALNGFKKGEYRVLVATDIAARGLDVKNIELVVNYDLPEQSEDYVHRIGRTGRADKTGHAISFATADQRQDVKIIERLINKELPVSVLPAHLPSVNFTTIVSGHQPKKNFKNKNFQKSPRPFSKPGERNNSRPNRFSAKPFADKKFSDKKTFSAKPFADKSFSAKPFSAKPASTYGHTAKGQSFGKPKSFGPKKYSNDQRPTSNSSTYHSKKPRFFADDLSSFDERPKKSFARRAAPAARPFNSRANHHSNNRPNKNFKPKRAF